MLVVAKDMTKTNILMSCEFATTQLINTAVTKTPNPNVYVMYKMALEIGTIFVRLNFTRY